MPRDEHEGEVSGEHDGRHDRGRDGEHEGDNPGRAVEHATRGGDGQRREEREAGCDWVQHEQDGEYLENEIR